MDPDGLAPTSSTTETLTSTFEPRPLLVEVPALVRVGAQPLQSGHSHYSRGTSTTVGVYQRSGSLSGLWLRCAGRWGQGQGRGRPRPDGDPDCLSTPTVVDVLRLWWLYPDCRGSTTTTATTPTQTTVMAFVVVEVAVVVMVMVAVSPTYKPTLQPRGLCSYPPLTVERGTSPFRQPMRTGSHHDSANDRSRHEVPRLRHP
jgi:hypothetical protein